MESSPARGGQLYADPGGLHARSQVKQRGMHAECGILTKFEAKYPGSAASSGVPTMCTVSLFRFDPPVIHHCVPSSSTFRRVLRPASEVWHSSKVFPFPQLAKGNSLNRDKGTAYARHIHEHGRLRERTERTYPSGSVIVQLREARHVEDGVRVVSRMLARTSDC